MRAWILAIVLLGIGGQFAAAKSELPARVYAAIEAAARAGQEAGQEPNFALQGAVIKAIVRDPVQVERIIALAVGLAPRERDRIITATAGAFPGFKREIIRGADSRRASPPPPTPQLVAPATAPAPYTPPQTAQAQAPESKRQYGDLKPSRPVARSQAGPYVDFGAGLALVADADLTDPTVPAVTGVLTSSAGFGLDGAVGYRFGNGFRSDIELAYRRNDLDTISLSAFGITITGDIAGKIAVFSALANGYYDVRIDRSMFVPYVGAGIGVALVNLEIDATGFDDTVTVFAYQLAAGVKFPLSSSLSARAGYKYFATLDPKFGTTEGEYMSHNFEIGVVYDF